MHSMQHKCWLPWLVGDALAPKPHSAAAISSFNSQLTAACECAGGTGSLTMQCGARRPSPHLQVTILIEFRSCLIGVVNQHSEAANCTGCRLG